MNTCDIIIPTYNGKDTLQQTISALIDQEIPAGWSLRLILSDDGSDDDASSCVAAHTWASPWLAPMVLRLPHQGRSHARNAAIRASNADILMFLADDIILRPQALQEHLCFHAAHPDINQAALGCVLWDPRVLPTPFMEWMMHGGQQNDYDSIVGVSVCSPSHYFYGSFVSLKKHFLASDTFSGEFLAYGWEDLELGARLDTRGLMLHVLHSARALHAHRYTADEILQRQRTVGSARYLVNTNTIRRVFHGIYGLSGARGLTRLFLRKWGDTINMPRFFALATAGEFWYGVHKSDKLLIKGKK